MAVDEADATCCACSGPSATLLLQHQKYVASLDLWLVSSGGVGSNSLVQQLKQARWLRGPKADRPLKVFRNWRWYEETTHAPRPLVLPASLKRSSAPQRALFILGDLRNSLSSVVRQGFARYNMEKILFGTNNQCCHGLTSRCSERHLARLAQMGHPDPFGIARQLGAFLDADAAGAMQVAFVRYPVTRASVDAAFGLLDMSINTSSVNADVVKRRRSLSDVSDSSSSRGRRRSPHQILEAALHRSYAELADAEAALPTAFRAADAPRELLLKVRGISRAVNETWLALESRGARTSGASTGSSFLR